MNFLLDILDIVGTKGEVRYLSQLAELDDEEVKQSFELGLAEASISGTNDIKVWNIEDKLGLVGAGSGVNILSTKGLKVLNFHGAMKSKDAD